MNICVWNRVLNEGILKIIEDTNILVPVIEDRKEPPIRLKEDSLPSASVATSRFSALVTAHNLSQYKNKIHSIRLEEDDMDDWFGALLNFDSEEY